MSTATKTWRSITAQELADVIASQGPVDIIDVRTPTEFREVHIEGARNVPLDRLQPADLVAGREADRPLYVVCRSGSRAAKACDAIFRSGFTSVVHVEGGTEACIAAGLPVVRGRKAISLERQVRIAAGLLVFVGSMLAVFVNPFWALLPAAVGAGLAQSGITDSCAMGMMLARMPWNQVKDAGAECAVDSRSAASGESQSDCCGG